MTARRLEDSTILRRPRKFTEGESAAGVGQLLMLDVVSLAGGAPRGCFKREAVQQDPVEVQRVCKTREMVVLGLAEGQREAAGRESRSCSGENARKASARSGLGHFSDPVPRPRKYRGRQAMTLANATPVPLRPRCLRHWRATSGSPFDTSPSLSCSQIPSLPSPCTITLLRVAGFFPCHPSTPHPIPPIITNIPLLPIARLFGDWSVVK